MVLASAMAEEAPAAAAIASGGDTTTAAAAVEATGLSSSCSTPSGEERGSCAGAASLCSGGDDIQRGPAVLLKRAPCCCSWLGEKDCTKDGDESTVIAAAKTTAKVVALLEENCMVAVSGEWKRCAGRKLRWSSNYAYTVLILY